MRVKLGRTQRTSLPLPLKDKIDLTESVLVLLQSSCCLEQRPHIGLFVFVLLREIWKFLLILSKYQ